MAATLVEGQKYGLDSNDFTSGNKTFIHFKLTDSALRALEEFSRIKEGCSRKPSIQFTNNTGVMSIPGQVSSHDPRAERHFQLNLAKIIGDANGSFDCIQQTRSRYSVGLSCLGSMQYKVSTNANNDVYSDTRKKIAIADNESKKICAKEIKMSGRFSGKKIKKVIPSSQYNAVNSGKPAPLSSSSSSSSSSRQASSSHSSSSLLTSNSSALPQSSASSATSRLTAPTPSTVSPLTHGGEGRSSSLSSSSAPRSTSLVSSNNGILKIGNSSGSRCSRAINLPFRDRVIHLLALRSYKKPELVYRLMKDGIHEKDRDLLDNVLKSISVTYKDNSYGLAKHAWQFFRADWPLYSDPDRQLAKRNQQVAESRSSASPTVAISPAVHPTDSPSPPQKRASEDAADLIFSSKKQRTARHQEKRPPPSQPSGKPPSASASKNKHHHCHSSYHQQQPQQYSDRTSSGSTGSLSSSSDSGIDSVSTVASGASDRDSPIPESPSSNCENQGKGDEQDSSLHDYMLQYVKIETCDQRHRYKEDFNKEYAEYRLLHEKLQNVSKRFEHLKERIDNTREGSQDYEELRNLVLEEYKQRKSDAQFVRHKKRVDYLHNKLGHIKQLIMDYDKDIHVSHCS